MILSFIGPYSADVLKDQEFSNSIQRPGVVILGFDHPEKKLFIPYLVRQTGVSTGQQLVRLYQNIFNPLTNTYPWLTENYLFGLNGVSPFYNDERLPDFCNSPLFAGTQVLPVWFRLHAEYFWKRFIYLNNRDFLQRKYHFLSLCPDYPMVSLGSDSLALIPYLERLEFCYALADDNGESILNFDYLEAFVRFILKGKTLNTSLNFADLNYMHKNGFPKFIIRNSIGFVDPLVHLFKENISMDFPGY